MITTFKILAVAASALAVTGCVSPWANEAGMYATPIGDAPVTANPTPYSNALVCMANYATATGKARPRIAVGRVLDYTGKEDLEGGRKVTQGASLMAMSAFAKAGAHLVERFDTSVSELELKYSNNRLIGADPSFEQGPAAPEFRQIMAGEIPGSDYYFVGGITELNSNIRSVGIDAFIGDLDPTDAKGRAGFKAFVINVGVDLRLVSTKTLEVVDVISYQKQIIGREISAGIFDFANGNIFDVGAGERAMEPIQLAIRLLVPQGSRMLELEEMRAVSAPFDAGSLTYPWRHPDPAVDALQKEVSSLVGSRLSAPRRDVFASLWEVAHARAAVRAPERQDPDLLPRAAIPYLNEPWYC